MKERTKSLAIAALAGAAAADSIYLKMYEERAIDRLWCPFTGNGCARVVDSPESQAFGISHTTIGLAGAAAMMGVALAQARRPSRGKRRLLQGMALGAVGGSVYLAWLQGAKVGAWCSLCLAAEALNVAMAALAVQPACLTGARGASAAHW